MHDKESEARLNAKINEYLANHQEMKQDKSAIVNRALESYAEDYRSRKAEYQNKKNQKNIKPFPLKKLGYIFFAISAISVEISTTNISDSYHEIKDLFLLLSIFSFIISFVFMSLSVLKDDQDTIEVYVEQGSLSEELNKISEQNPLINKLKEFFEQDLLMKKLIGVFFIFAVISFSTMLILDSNSGPSYKGVLPPVGGLVGPITVNSTVYLINVDQPVSTNQWSYVGGTVLDVNKQPLMEFGKDLWSEEGINDIGQSWKEYFTSYGAKLTFPIMGVYYIQFESEQSKPGVAGDISVEIVPKLASSLAFVWLGTISSILSLIFLGIYVFKNNSDDKTTGNFGKVILKYLFYGILIAMFIWSVIWDVM